MPRNAVQVIARFWVICFLCALIPFGLPAVLAGVLSLPFLAFIALIVAIGFNAFQWLGHKLLLGGTKEYKDLRANGLDPWFDVNCPWPFRPETDDEPEIRWFCRNCHSEAFDPEAPCPVCHYEQYECGNCGAPVKNEFAACRRCGNNPLG